MTQITENKIKLHDCCSVFQAELLATEKACNWIITKNISAVFILTDCRSGLDELSNPNSHNQIAVNIHKHIHAAKLANINIGFVWVRGHTGIGGNEWADHAAKVAAKLHKQADYLTIPVSYIKLQNKALSRNKAIELYNKSTYTKTLFPTLSDLTQFLSYIEPQFAITQLLTNHGYRSIYTDLR